ncbi:MAG TPA: DUF58 domain-containing protein [Acidimicrobiales bacterium]|nr:DUF58 domain-containing protein [Acidimicrobiales bacterium]
MSPGEARAARRDRPRGARPRPEKIVGPVLAALTVLGAWVAVAHSSGDGWVQSLGALIGGFLIVGLVGPAAHLRRARLRVVDNPLDGMAGSGMVIELEVNAPLRLRPIDPPGPIVVANGRQPVRLGIVPDHRGVLLACVVETASAAPFGLLWWTSRRVLPLVRPLTVSPRHGLPQATPPRRADAGGDAALLAVQRRSGEPRGVRPYVAGDPPRSVHWPATAHQGSLMVREMEAAAEGSVTLTVVLPEDPVAAERAAERALATAARLLRGGRSVQLVTTEVDRTVSGRVATPLEAGRRLARAQTSPWVGHPR